MRGVWLAAVLVAQLAPAQTVEVLRSNGPPSNRIDLAIVGDGYTDAGQAQLTADATALIDGLLDFAPYRQFAQLFNVKLIHGVSNEAGADDGAAGGQRDTRYGARFGCGGIDRLVCVDDGAVLAEVQAFAPEADLTIVVVNDAKFGGGGGAITVASTHPAYLDILRHEFGHTLAHLADEYTEPYPGYPACSASADCPEPNATLSWTRATLKWGAWVEASTPLPSSKGFSGVGAFEGARYLTTGVFRPVDSRCQMNALGNPFCPVCAEALVLAMSNYLEWLEGPAPATTTIRACLGGGDVELEAPHLAAPGFVFDYAWIADGQVMAGNSSKLLPLQGLGEGSHRVVVMVQVSTTLVRADPGKLLQGEHVWTVEVQACGDGGEPDSGASPEDAGAPDAGAGQPDGGSLDGGSGGGGAGGCGCGQVAGAELSGLVLALGALRRRATPRRRGGSPTQGVAAG